MGIWGYLHLVQHPTTASWLGTRESVILTILPSDSNASRVTIFRPKVRGDDALDDPTPQCGIQRVDRKNRSDGRAPPPRDGFSQASSAHVRILSAETTWRTRARASLLLTHHASTTRTCGTCGNVSSSRLRRRPRAPKSRPCLILILILILDFFFSHITCRSVGIPDPSTKGKGLRLNPLISC